MRLFREFILLIVVSSFTFSIARAQQDSVLHAKDSVIAADEGTCTDNFFYRCERVGSLGKTYLTIKSKTVTMLSFLKTYNMGVWAQHGVVDLDNDGKKELVIFNYTNGAHCCDDYYFFRNTGPNRYQLAGRTHAGHVCIDSTKEIRFDLHEHFGYFFTCYACGHSDTSDAAPINIQSIALRYNKGRLQPVPGDQELRSIINDNLGKYADMPYEKLDDHTPMDDGIRKEMALNLAVYYFAFGKNMAETLKLFNKYYKFPDAKDVSLMFVRVLQAIEKNNTF